MGSLLLLTEKSSRCSLLARCSLLVHISLVDDSLVCACDDARCVENMQDHTSSANVAASLRSLNRQPHDATASAVNFTPRARSTFNARPPDDEPQFPLRDGEDHLKSNTSFDATPIHRSSSSVSTTVERRYFAPNSRVSVRSTVPYTSVSRQGLAPSKSEFLQGTETDLDPPRTLRPQRSYTREELSRRNPTAAWLEGQKTTASTPTSTAFSNFTNNTRNTHVILDDPRITTSRPVIRPIRSFHSIEMNGQAQSYRFDGGRFDSRRSSRTDEEEEEDDDRDRTLRALEGTGNRGYPNGTSTNGHKAEEDQRRMGATASEKRKSRIAFPLQRLSMPTTSYQRQNDGQMQDQSPQSARMDQPPQHGQRSTTTGSKPLGDLGRSRYSGGIPRSSSVTQRAPTLSNGELSSASKSPSAAGRRPSTTDASRGNVPESPRRTSEMQTSRRSSVTESMRKPSNPETALSFPRSQYRSNLSYSSPRNYNSSPLTSKAMEPSNEAELPRENTDETESTTSTTAQSTIWDELDDIKQRMRRLEVIGKMPATSGAAVLNSSNERPRTATTTVTTNSSSPKRARGNSAVSHLSSLTISEAHPNLRVALAKSKSLLNRDVYDALEKTASDALTISSMMGPAGQPGPMSSAASAVGASSSIVSDRQVRKKADNMCRSLTELCIALNERNAEDCSAVESTTMSRPTTRAEDVRRPTTRAEESPELPQHDTTSTMRKVSDVGSQALARLKASPRTLSRLAERRNNLFQSSSSLPTSPRNPSNGASTPTPQANTGRRTSLLLRSRRAVTEEPESIDSQESSFRAPSRAVTDRVRSSPREYTSNGPLPEVQEPMAQHTPSSLPLRRHFASNSLTSSSPLTPTPSHAVSRLESRRYLERAANRFSPDQGSGIPPPTPRTSNEGAQRRSMGYSSGIPPPTPRDEAAQRKSVEYTTGIPPPTPRDAGAQRRSFGLALDGRGLGRT